MPDQIYSRKTLRAGTPLRVGATTLVPIQSVAIHSWKSTAPDWFVASSEPIALVVRDANDIRVIGIREQVSLEQLREQVPDLDKLILPS